jgi:hypothetical protein
MVEHRESQRAEGEPVEDTLAGLGGIDPEEALRAAAEAAREHPHTAIAGAFAIGFLLGGGLTPRLLASLALLAGRRYAAAAAREALDATVRGGIDEVTAH